MNPPNFVPMKKWIFLFAFLFVIGLSESSAQCPMCRTAVESGMNEEGNTKGRGLNDGIIYLLAAPYLAIGIVGGIWYKKNKAK